MTDGARTRDNRHHKPGLYQLSYSHHACRAMPDTAWSSIAQAMTTDHRCPDTEPSTAVATDRAFSVSIPGASRKTVPR